MLEGAIARAAAQAVAQYVQESCATPTSTSWGS